MSRRRVKLEFQKAIATLKTDISSEIQTTIARELAKLEVVACTSSATPTSSQPPDRTPSPAPVPTSKGRESDQDGHITITPDTGQAIYRVIEACEDVIQLGRSGKMRSFEKKAQELELLICGIDTEMLEKIDLTAEQPKN